MNVFSLIRNPVMDFKRIRNGTVFTVKNPEGKAIAYIKGSDIQATDVKTGEVLQPKKGDGVDWGECVIHNRTSLNLY